MDGGFLHNPTKGLYMCLYLAYNGPDIVLIPRKLDIVECSGMTPLTDALHFIGISVYSSVTYYMTEAFQSL